MASGDAVEQIKNRLSIVDVVAPYVELHQAGKHLKGRCPFHSEKTPSFNVSADRGTYHCFGCGVGGDIFTFIEATDGVDFKGALKILAEKAGVELVPEDPKKRSERDTLYLALEEAVTVYERNISSKPAVLEYLRERGVSDVTRARWRIGYAKDEWRSLAGFLAEKNIAPDIVRKAGLTKGESGKEPYDVFRDRVMFPIFDASGRVVAFSGRIFTKGSEAPKYVNSPETELFHKSEILYGYDRAKQSIRKMDFSLIVEGQFDVVMSHQAGYTNTVAVSGTALTAHHVGLLQRLSNRVVLALDGDAAGIKAVKRAAELMLGRGMDVKVATLPAGKDPADLVQHDPAAYKQAVGHATHVIEFLLANIRQSVADERTYKLRVRDEVLPFVAHIASHIDREHFEGVVATATHSTPDAIHLEVERIKKIADTEATQPVAKSESQPVKPVSSTLQNRANELGAMVVVSCAILEPALRSVLERVIKSATGMTLEAYKETLPAAAIEPLHFTLEERYEGFSRKQRAEYLADTIESWKQVVAKTEGQRLRQSRNEAELKGDTETATALLVDIQRMDALRHAPPVTVEDILEAA